MSQSPFDDTSYKDELQSLKSSNKSGTNNRGQRQQPQDEMQKLRSLVMINLAATSVVLLLLIAFLVTYLVNDNNNNKDNNTCDCECLYEFPPPTPTPTTLEDLFNSNTTIMESQIGGGGNSTTNTTVFPWDPDIVIDGRTFVSSSEELKQAVNDAKTALYDPAAEVFAEYGYPMGNWYV